MSTQKKTTKTTLSASITPDRFLDAINSAGTLVEECKVHLNKDGVTIRAVDPANVAMVDLDLDKEAFETYRAQETVIGVKLPRLTEVLSMMDNEDPASIEVLGNNTMNVSSNGLDFSISLIDPSTIRTEPDIPDLDVPAEVVLEGSDINRGVKAADMVSDHIELGVDEETNTFTIKARGDTDNVELTLTESELLDLTPGPADSIYSLDYLKDINKAIPSNAEVSMNLGEEYPAMLSFTHVYPGDQADASLDVTFVVAPRIET